MMRTYFLMVLTAIAATPSFAKVIEDHRCERDSLDVAQANGRLDWAVNNKITDAYNIPWTSESAKRHREMWDFHPVLKGRPLYPTYGVPAGANIWSYPGDWRAPTVGTARTSLPAGYRQSAICTSSCYRPQMRLFFARGVIDIASARARKLSDLMVLDESSTREKLVWKKADTTTYSSSIEDFDHDILVITAAGAALHVTPNHTFVDGEGALREASSFKVGESLVRVDGSKAEITAIESERYRGKVLNVRADYTGPKSQILAAEGFLTGSAYYQNVELNDANRHLLRMNIDP